MSSRIIEYKTSRTGVVRRQMSRVCKKSVLRVLFIVQGKYFCLVLVKCSY